MSHAFHRNAQEPWVVAPASRSLSPALGRCEPASKGGSMRAVTDLDLLDRWRAGDRAAGNDLFKRHFDSIWRFFQNKLDGDIDELVQSTFLACVKSRDQFRKQSSFRTYLFTIARHELYRFLRQRQRDSEALDFGVTSLADLGTTPRSWLARNQDHHLLLRALHRLPVEQQTLLELHYWENMTPKELAEVFDMSASTTRTRLARARKALRAAIQELASGESAPMHESDESLDRWARSLQAARAVGGRKPD